MEDDEDVNKDAYEDKIVDEVSKDGGGPEENNRGVFYRKKLRPSGKGPTFSALRAKLSGKEEVKDGSRRG